jgi:hypothetical protein
VLTCQIVAGCIVSLVSFLSSTTRDLPPLPVLRDPSDRVPSPFRADPPSHALCAKSKRKRKPISPEIALPLRAPIPPIAPSCLFILESNHKKKGRQQSSCYRNTPTLPKKVCVVTCSFVSLCSYQFVSFSKKRKKKNKKTKEGNSTEVGDLFVWGQSRF